MAPTPSFPSIDSSERTVRVIRNRFGELLHMTRDLLYCFTDLSVADASNALGVGHTTMKKLRRWMGLQRWPHRRVTTTVPPPPGERRRGNVRMASGPLREFEHVSAIESTRKNAITIMWFRDNAMAAALNRAQGMALRNAQREPPAETKPEELRGFLDLLDQLFDNGAPSPLTAADVEEYTASSNECWGPSYASVFDVSSSTSEPSSGDTTPVETALLLL